MNSTAAFIISTLILAFSLASVVWISWNIDREEPRHKPYLGWLARAGIIANLTNIYFVYETAHRPFLTVGPVIMIGVTAVYLVVLRRHETEPETSPYA